MKSKILVIIIISIVVVGTFMYKSKRNIQVRGVETQKIFESQNRQMGEVEVEVTPDELKSGQNMIFNISLNTHSVDLSYDYTKIVSVYDNNGNNYKILNWTGKSGGHHLGGDIETEPLMEKVKSIKLIIDGIDDQEEFFEWEL